MTQPNQSMDDLAVVHFSDGIVIGPQVGLRDVGSELAELILGTLDQIENTEGLLLSVGTATAVFAFRAVGTGNHVSVNTPMVDIARFGMSLGHLFRPELSVGGVGMVVIDINAGIVHTYGGRGFPEVCPAPLFMHGQFPIEELAMCTASGIEKPAAPVKKAAKKKAGRKKAAKKKAAKKRAPAGEDDAPGDVSVTVTA